MFFDALENSTLSSHNPTELVPPRPIRSKLSNLHFTLTRPSIKKCLIFTTTGSFTHELNQYNFGFYTIIPTIDPYDYFSE